MAREILPLGASFYDGPKGSNVVWFRFVMDPSSRIERLATEEDIAKYPAAYQSYVESQPAKPERPESLEELTVAELTELLDKHGVNVSGGTKKAELIAMVEALYGDGADAS